MSTSEIRTRAIRVETDPGLPVRTTLRIRAGKMRDFRNHAEGSRTRPFLRLFANSIKRNRTRADALAGRSFRE